MSMAMGRRAEVWTAIVREIGHGRMAEERECRKRGIWCMCRSVAAGPVTVGVMMVVSRIRTRRRRGHGPTASRVSSSRITDIIGLTK